MILKALVQANTLLSAEISCPEGAVDKAGSDGSCQDALYSSRVQGFKYPERD